MKTPRFLAVIAVMVLIGSIAFIFDAIPPIRTTSSSSIPPRVAATASQSAPKEILQAPSTNNVPSKGHPRPLEIDLIPDAQTGRAFPAVKGQVLVQFARELSEQDATEWALAHRATIKRANRRLGFFCLELPPSLSVDGLTKQVKADPIVKHIEPNYAVSALAETIDAKNSGSNKQSSAVALPAVNQNDSPAAEPTNDPLFPQQWALHVLQVTNLWQSTNGSSNIVVAILDTGIDGGHADAPQRQLPGYNFVDHDANPTDDNGHGTHVAGIIAAKANNGLGITGLASGCSILPIKVLDKEGYGSCEMVIEAMDYAVDHQAKILNLSFGTHANSRLLEEAIAKAVTSGCIVIAAAGNEADPLPVYPAAYPGVVSVIGVDRHGVASKTSLPSGKASMLAPGVDILSLIPGNGYDFRSGSSAAAAHASGIAALILSGQPSLAGSNVLQSLADILASPAASSWRVNDTDPIPKASNNSQSLQSVPLDQQIPPEPSKVKALYGSAAYLFSSPVHQWIALQAYNKLDPVSPQALELAQYLPTDPNSIYYSQASAYGNGQSLYEAGFGSEIAVLAGAHDADIIMPVTTMFSKMPNLIISPLYYGLDLGIDIVTGLREHYWDPDGGYAAGLPGSTSALADAQDIFARALYYYAFDKKQSYYWLGYTAHLLADMAVPAHTLLDDHVFLGPDSYESYVGANNHYREITGGHPESRIPSLETLPVYQSNPPDCHSGLSTLFYHLAKYSKEYDSDHKDGQNPEHGQGAFRYTRATIDPIKPISRVEFVGYLVSEEVKPEEYVLRQNPFDNHLYLKTRFFSQHILATLEGLSGLGNIAITYADGSHENQDLEMQYWGIWDDVLRNYYEANLESRAIGYTAALYQLFWKETHSESKVLGLNASLPSQGRIAIAPKPTEFGHRYAKGTRVTLTARLEPGETVRWSGDFIGTDNPVILTMDTDKKIHANIITPCETTTMRGDFLFSGGGVDASVKREDIDQRIPVVLVHGLNGEQETDSLNLWKWWIDAFNLTPYRNQYQLYRFVYDSNRHITENGSDLAHFAANYTQFQGKKIVILAHSMGGLVARSAMNQDSAFREKVAKLITLGTPHLGSPGATVPWVNLYLAGLEAEFIEDSDGCGDLAWYNPEDIPQVAEDLIYRCTPYFDQDRLNQMMYSPYLGRAGVWSQSWEKDKICAFGGATTGLEITGYADTLIKSVKNHGKLCAGALLMSRMEKRDSTPFTENDGLVPLESALYKSTLTENANAFNLTKILNRPIDHLSLLDDGWVIGHILSKLPEIHGLPVIPASGSASYVFLSDQEFELVPVGASKDSPRVRVKILDNGYVLPVENGKSAGLPFALIDDHHDSLNVFLKPLVTGESYVSFAPQLALNLETGVLVSKLKEFIRVASDEASSLMQSSSTIGSYQKWTPAKEIAVIDQTGATQETLVFKVYLDRSQNRIALAFQPNSTKNPGPNIGQYNRLKVRLTFGGPCVFEWEDFPYRSVGGIIDDSWGEHASIISVPESLLPEDVNHVSLEATPFKKDGTGWLFGYWLSPPVYYTPHANDGVFSQLMSGYPPSSQLYSSGVSPSALVNEVIAENNQTVTIEYGSDYILRFEDSKTGACLGLSESRRQDIGRLLAATLYLDLSGVDQDKQAQLWYQTDLLLQEFPASPDGTVQTYAVPLPPHLLVYNNGSCELRLRNSAKTPFLTWLWNLGRDNKFTVHKARLQLVYLKKGTEPSNWGGGWKLTDSGPSLYGNADGSYGWNYFWQNGMRVNNTVSQTVSPSTIVQDNNLQAVKTGRMSLVVNGLSDYGAKISLKDANSDWIVAGYLTPNAEWSHRGLTHVANAFLDEEVTAKLDPKKPWTIKLDTLTPFTILNWDFAFDYTTTSPTPPEVVSTFPRAGSTVNYVDQNIWLGFSKPMDFILSEGISVVESVNNEERPVLLEGFFTPPDGKNVILQCNHFTPGAKVTVKVNQTIGDLWGGHLAAPFQYSFNVSDYYETIVSPSQISHISTITTTDKDGHVTTSKSTNSSLVVGRGLKQTSTGSTQWNDETSFVFDFPDLSFATDRSDTIEFTPYLSGYAGTTFPPNPLVNLLNSGGNQVFSQALSSAVKMATTAFLNAPTGANRMRMIPGDGNYSCFASISGLGIRIRYGSLDRNPPKIIQTTPATNAVAIAKNTKITLVFDQMMNPGSLHESSINLTGNRSGSHAFRVSSDPNAQTFSLIPLQEFASSETVTLEFWDNPIEGRVLDMNFKPLPAGSFSFTIKDTTPPMAPLGFHYSEDNGQITLQWNATTKDTEGYDETLAGYNVYRMMPPATEYTKLNQGPWAGTSFKDTGLVNFRDYYYRITAVDASGNESTPSSAVKLSPHPTAGPVTISGGTFNYDQTWPAECSPYLITGDLILQGGARFTIGSGAELRFDANKRLDVDGVLDAQGQSNQKIVFQSSAATPKPGDWQGIIVRNGRGQEGMLKYFEIRHARRGLELISDTMRVEDGVIQEYSEMGIHLQNSQAQLFSLDLRESEINRWKNIAVSIDTSSTPILDGFQIAWNTRGVQIDSSAPVMNNLKIERTKEAAIYVSGVSNFRLTGSELVNNYGYGIQYNGNGQKVNVFVKNNKIYHNANLAFTASGTAADSRIMANDNYWGTEDPLVVTSLVQDSVQNRSWGTVSHAQISSLSLQSVASANVLQGTYSGDVHLTTANSPYRVTGNVIFEGWCIIDPGVEIQVEGNYEILWKWVVQANGTSPMPIKFVPGASLAPNSKWQGLRLGSGASLIECVLANMQIIGATTGIAMESSAELNHLAIENCTTGINFTSSDRARIPKVSDAQIHNTDTAIQANLVPVQLENCRLWNDGLKAGSGTGITFSGDWTSIIPVIRQCDIKGFNMGIYLGGRVDAQITGNLIRNNASYGIFLYGNAFPRPVITGNRFSGNGYALYASGQDSDSTRQVIDATGNWWGSANPTAVASSIYEATDQDGLARVNFLPFWTTEQGTPSASNILGGYYGTQLTLSQTAGPYHVVADLVCVNGLSVEAGTVFSFDRGTGLQLLGELRLMGTTESPIIFQSAAEIPNPGDWKGLTLTEKVNGELSDINQIIIRHAKTGITMALSPSPAHLSQLLIEQCNTGMNFTSSDRARIPKVSDAQVHNTDTAIQANLVPVQLENCRLWNDGLKAGSGTGITFSGDWTSIIPVIRQCDIKGFNIGIYLGGRIDAQITGNLIRNNASYGIFLYGNAFPRPVITGNRFSGNGYALYASGQDSDSTRQVIDATGNWWGTRSLEIIDSLIFDRKDGSGLAVVNYLPIMNDPPRLVVTQVTPQPVTAAIPVGELRVSLRFPVSMNRTKLPKVRIVLPTGVSGTSIDLQAEGWTLAGGADVFSWINASPIDYRTALGNHLLQFDEAVAADGTTDFAYEHMGIQVNIPSDSSFPGISQVTVPTYWREDQPFEIKATISDVGLGNHGVVSAWLLGKTSSSNSIQIIGIGPGGTGDGQWSFMVPAQIGQGGKTFYLGLVAQDNTGRTNGIGYGYGVQIIGLNEDADHNGAADWWELQYFNRRGVGRNEDSDRDGVRNVLEILLGTKPNDANDSKLIGWWPFDDLTGADSSGHGNPGIISGATNTANAVMGGKALQFSKVGDNVSLGFSPTLKTAVFTLHGFVNVNRIPSAGEAILWNNLMANAGARLAINTGGQLVFRTRGSGGESVTASGVSLQTNRWYQFAVASDSQQLEMYLDGALVTTGVCANRIDPAAFTERTIIGNLATPTATNQFYGILDDLHFWNVRLTPEQLAMASFSLNETFSQPPNWFTGFMDGQYTVDDRTNFIWDPSTQVLTVVQPNKAADPTLKYGYEYLDNNSWSLGFTFRFDVAIITPGYETPLRIGLKQSAYSPWNQDTGLSCAFTFRSSGFKLELFARDGAGQVKTNDWPDGFQLHDPPRWVRGEYVYDANTRQLRFILWERETGAMLATNVRTNVNGFGSLDKLVISQRGDEYGSSGYAGTNFAQVDNLQVLPYPSPTVPMARSKLQILDWKPGAFRMQLSGSLGSPYLIQYSTNLSQWTDLFVTNAPAASFEFHDDKTAGFNRKFYRVLSIGR